MHDQSRRSFLAAAGSLSLVSLVPGALAQGKIKAGPDTALVVVDVQNCFTPGGSLAVKGGDEIVPLINKIARGFQNVC
jgi:nicotinamidase/pyrazinamidase